MPPSLPSPPPPPLEQLTWPHLHSRRHAHPQLAYVSRIQRLRPPLPALGQPLLPHLPPSPTYYLNTTLLLPPNPRILITFLSPVSPSLCAPQVCPPLELASSLLLPLLRSGKQHQPNAFKEKFLSTPTIVVKLDPMLATGGCGIKLMLSSGGGSSSAPEERVILNGATGRDDVLYPHLTVRETLVFCTMLWLLRKVAREEKVAVAEAVITELGCGSARTPSWAGSLAGSVTAQAGQHRARDAGEPEPATARRADVGAGLDDHEPACGDAGRAGEEGENGGDINPPAGKPCLPNVRRGAPAIGGELLVLQQSQGHHGLFWLHWICSKVPCQPR
ncbi:hypothetical protein Cni_G26094 [Canna indica]|uniref:Uncharacterized protein n=1 Tax=Canna indica TaxID=4628 RepID=A0AAQ3L2A8_9LILI|nr:hypothetical protein Cni_G26094 [Canna indica]